MSWQAHLRQSLNRQPSPPLPDRPPRVAVVGIGQELNGDDAAGVLVARKLQQTLKTFETSRVLAIDAGPAPENCTGLLRRFQPNLVLLVDAARMDAPPGTIRWLTWQETTGLSASTHTLPPYLLAQYLEAELGCEVALLGLEPAATAPGTSLTPTVQAAVAEVVKELVKVLDITQSKRRDSVE